jgi:hypothetical protein
MTLSEQHPFEMLPVRVLPLSQGKFTLVDPDDPLEPWQFKWTATNNRYRWYAVRRVRRPDGSGYDRVYLHRYLTGAPDKVDHRNEDGLDNRRCNIRVATNAQNMAAAAIPRKDNTSGHTGVSFYKRTEHWVATAGNEYVGYFATFDVAVDAYHKAMAAKYGEFAPKCCPGTGKES